jgi:hypothetical protein
MASKMSKGEWTMLYIVTGTLDFVQFFVIEVILVWFFGAGVAINEVLDPIVAGGLLVYFPLRGVSLIKEWKRVASILGFEGASAITGGAAQLWVFDVWYIHSDVKREEAEEKALEANAQQEQMQEDDETPQNVVDMNGEPVRLPRGNVVNTMHTIDSNGEPMRRPSNVIPMTTRKEVVSTNIKKAA